MQVRDSDRAEAKASALWLESAVATAASVATNFQALSAISDTKNELLPEL